MQLFGKMVVMSVAAGFFMTGGVVYAEGKQERKTVRNDYERKSCADLKELRSGVEANIFYAESRARKMRADIKSDGKNVNELNKSVQRLETKISAAGSSDEKKALKSELRSVKKQLRGSEKMVAASKKLEARYEKDAKEEYEDWEKINEAIKQKGCR